MDKILVVDLGGQYAHLIANRVRRLGVLADISLPEDTLIDINDKDIRGLILSGGPSSVYENNSPNIPEDVINSGLPILGICYGHQLLAYRLGGQVKRGDTKEYGITKITLSEAISENTHENILFHGLENIQTVWMSHGDSVSELPIGFQTMASSDDCEIVAMADDERRLYGLQFHPEVTHTINGMKILENFIFGICGCEKDWNPNNYLEDISKNITRLAEDKKVFLLVSGGVDSVVLFSLLNKTLGKERVFGLHVDNGLMRLDESSGVIDALHKLGFDNLEVIDASSQFLESLENVVDPEKKRKIIGDLFIDIIDQHSDKLLSSDDWLIAQGTIYPDTIETKGTKNSDLIKTHHNRVPKMQLLIAKGKVIEPLSHLYKDEVRMVGRLLGLPSHVINRHPFPGPGLGVRILCNDNISEDIIAIEEKIKSVNPDAIALPIKSVGVQGDSRTYKHPAMISETEWSDWNSLEKQSTELTNKVVGINRVLLLVCKKPGDIRLSRKTITKDRVKLLQQVDDLVTKIIRRYDLYDKIWQMPVVLAPLTVDRGECIILRPVDSQEAMTACFSRIPQEIVKEIGEEIMKIPGIDMVFYDITNKPPGTIEWE